MSICEIVTRICAFLSSLMAFVCVAVNVQTDFVVVTMYGVVMGLMVISILTCLASFLSTRRGYGRADVILCAVFAVAFLVLAIGLLAKKSSQKTSSSSFSG